MSYETVVNYIAGVRKLHELAGFNVPGPGDPNLKHILRAIRQELAHPIKQAAPISPQILKEIYNWVDLTNIVDIVCYTALLVGFYLFLRNSNLVPGSKSKFDPQKQLIRSDIQVGSNVILVVIKWSKTIQYQEKQVLLPVLPAKDLKICPVFWLKLILNKVKAGMDAPLFCTPQENGVVPITYDQLADRLKYWVGKTGAPSGKYTLHGLRHGGACHALEVGLVGEDLKLMGDWATDAYMRYLDITLQRRVDNMVQFMREL